MNMLIYNATVMTMSGLTLQPGYVLTDQENILLLGAGVPPEDVWRRTPQKKYDAAGGYVLPGFIDAHCHLGLFDDGIADEGHDANESTDPVTPQLVAIDGIYQEDRGFAEAVASGVTTVLTGPGSANVLAGHFSLLHTCGRTVDTMALHTHAAMKAALGENPKRVHGQQGKRTPATRMATAAVLRNALRQAQDYQDQKKREAFVAYDARWEALLPVLRGDMLLKIHAHRSDDILTAVRIAKAFGLHYSLEHCTEGYRIADILAEEYEAGQDPDCGRGHPGKAKLAGIVTGPLLSDRGKPELSRLDIQNPAVLCEAGLPVAIMSDHPELPIQYLSLSAAVAVRGGMREEDALAAITIRAAALCGIADRLGSLEIGKQADLAVFSGHPLDFRSHTELVLIAGETVYERSMPDE